METTQHLAGSYFGNEVKNNNQLRPIENKYYSSFFQIPFRTDAPNKYYTLKQMSLDNIKKTHNYIPEEDWIHFNQVGQKQQINLITVFIQDLEKYCKIPYFTLHSYDPNIAKIYTTKVDMISKLPIEIAHKIFFMLDDTTLKQCARVSSKWYKICIQDKKIEDRLKQKTTLNSKKMNLSFFKDHCILTISPIRV